MKSFLAIAGLCAAVLAAPNAAASTQSAAPPTSQRTVVHPGDQVSVQVFGDSTLSQNVIVLDDGTIDYPLIGRVAIGGHTPAEAGKILANKLLRFVRQPVVTVSILTLAQPTVLVLGDVKNPGKYQLRSDGRVTDAIAAAGGLADENGAYPEARVADASGKVTTVSLQQLLRQGATTLDAPLGEGSIVYVPGPTHFTVDVAGAVDHPGDIQVSEGDRLSVAIAKAGNSSNAHSDLNHIRVMRMGTDGQQKVQEINLYQAINDGNEAADIALVKGDVIFVPQSKNHTNLMDSTLYILSRLIP